MERVRERWRGVLLCFCIAVPCYFLGKVVPIICNFGRNGTGDFAAEQGQPVGAGTERH